MFAICAALMSLQLPDGTEIQVGGDRFQIPELLFQPVSRGEQPQRPRGYIRYTMPNVLLSVFLPAQQFFFQLVRCGAKALLLWHIMECNKDTTRYRRGLWEAQVVT